MSRSNTLTEIWNTYNKSVLSENVPGVKAAKMGTKAKPPVDLNNVKHGFANDNSTGPGNVEVLQEPIDPKTATKEDELYNSSIYSSEKYTKKDKKLEKKVKESINNNMKSTFDKLFENVMSEEMHSDQETQELDALGIDTEVSETDDEGKVTLTLDRDMVQQLCDVLKEALGEDDDDDAEDMEHEDMEHEDYEMEERGFDESEEDGEDHDDEDEDTHKEAVDAEELGHALVNQKDSGLSHPGNNKVGTVKPKSGKSTGSTKKYVDAEPKPLADGKGKLQSKANKVALQAGADFIS